MLGRLLQTADFERVLALPPRSRSAHFAVHHLAARPASPSRRASAQGSTELSTGDAPICAQPVDDLTGQWWLGTVVPKRHARRALTRNLIKRQMRGVVASCVDEPAAALPGGLWVIRLRAPFDRQRYPSAASDALRRAARDELTQLLSRAAQGAAPDRPGRIGGNARNAG